MVDDKPVPMQALGRRHLGGSAANQRRGALLLPRWTAPAGTRDEQARVLVEAETGRNFARFESPDLCPVQPEGAAFGPDGSQLVVVTNDGPAVHVWDLRAIRKHLVAMGLDWHAPPYPEADPSWNEPLPPVVVLPAGAETRVILEQQRSQ